MSDNKPDGEVVRNEDDGEYDDEPANSRDHDVEQR